MMMIIIIIISHTLHVFACCVHIEVLIAVHAICSQSWVGQTVPDLERTL